jgi:arylsulfatase A-like enzyme
VVLISLDTVRADHLGAYGYDRPTSPHVDALARRSVVFERAISQSAWTLPAHGSMMTGIYPGRLGVAHYPARRRIPKNVPMLAEAFRKAGYATGGFTGGGFVAGHFGFDRGFDVYRSNGRRFENNLEDAFDWLEAHRDDRFFLFLHGYNAHRPYFSLAVDKATVGLPASAPVERKGFCIREGRDQPRDRELESIIKYYDAAIHHGDRQVGRFLDRLAEMGLDRRTVIVVTSDHGEEFFEHGNCDHVRFLYREVVHVPLIVHVPGLAEQPRREKALVPGSIAIARTLLDLVGIDHDMPGPSLVELLEGRGRQFDAVYSETDSVAGKLGSRGETIAITTPREKLISYLEEGSDEAFDTIRDPGERTILPPDHEAYDQRRSLRGWHSAMAAIQEPVPTAATSARRRANKPQTVNPNRGTEPRRARPAPARAQRGPSPPVPGAAAEDDPPESDGLPPDLQEDLRGLGYLE